jgi:hypothetical protein
MADDPGRRDGMRRAAARLGVVACAFGVFSAGWLAMSTSDWRRMLLYTVAAGVAGWLASALARLGR